MRLRELLVTLVGVLFLQFYHCKVSLNPYQVGSSGISALLCIHMYFCLKGVYHKSYAPLTR